jgi:hypothetical protein
MLYDVHYSGFMETGGYENMIRGYYTAISTEERLLRDPDDPSAGYCADPPRYAMHLFRSPAAGESDLPWTGLVFGVSVSALWYWCTDQVLSHCI